jgi:acetyltransferase
MRTPPSLPTDLKVDKAKADATIKTAIAAGRSVLSEVEAKQLLVAYGISTVPTEIARDPAEVGALAAGFIAEHGACVVKILSHDISHKSDVGGRAVGIGARRRGAASGGRHAAAHRSRQTGRPHRRLHGAADDPPPPRA